MAVAAGGLLLVFRRSQGFSARPVIIVAIGLSLVLAFLLTPPGENLRLRFVQWRQDLGGTRIGVWRESPVLIRQHLLLGGVDVFGGERAQGAVLFSVVCDEDVVPDFEHVRGSSLFTRCAALRPPIRSKWISLLNRTVSEVLKGAA